MRGVTGERDPAERYRCSQGQRPDNGCNGNSFDHSTHHQTILLRSVIHRTSYNYHLHHRTTISTTLSPIPTLQFTLVMNPFMRIMHRALSCGGTLLRLMVAGYIHIKLKVITTFRANNTVESSHDAGIIVPDETPEELGQTDEPEADIVAAQDIIHGVTPAPVPLLGSLYGILEQHA